MIGGLKNIIFLPPFVLIESTQKGEDGRILELRQKFCISFASFQFLIMLLCSKSLRKYW